MQYIWFDGLNYDRNEISRHAGKTCTAKWWMCFWNEY